METTLARVNNVLKLTIILLAHTFADFVGVKRVHNGGNSGFLTYSHEHCDSRFVELPLVNSSTENTTRLEWFWCHLLQP